MCVTRFWRYLSLWKPSLRTTFPVFAQSYIWKGERVKLRENYGHAHGMLVFFIQCQFLNKLNKIWMTLDFITCNCSMGGCSTGSGVGSGTCSAFAWEIVAKGSSSCGGGSTTSNEDGSWIYKSICFYFTGPFMKSNSKESYPNDEK